MTLNSKKFDFIIVGQGLAGSILAAKLLGLGREVAVIDNALQGSSSAVAAGIINPITGHRLNLTDGFERYYPIAEQFYEAVEHNLNCKFWRPINQIRLIKNQGQLDHYKRRLDQASYQSYLQTNTEEDLFRNPCFSSTKINKTAVIDTKTFLNNFQSKLQESGRLFTNKVDYAAIQSNGKNVVANGISASAIIFCEGYQAINNPWLADLPFKLSKGEIFTVSTETKVSAMLNWGHWLVPQHDSVKLGSSFEWHDLSTKNTIKTEQSLMKSLQQHTQISARIVTREAGVRPTTLHRKPFIGKMSGWNNGYCFNGFGSKGCLLIPFYADMLSQHLVSNAPLSPELAQCL